MRVVHHNTFYRRYLYPKFNEVFEMEPNEMGYPWLTYFYRSVVSHLKSMPFLYVIPVAGFIALISYLLFGQLVIKLVSLLQHGF